MRCVALALALVHLACGGTAKPPPTPDPQPASTTGDGGACFEAQKLELDTWIADMVVDTGDEIEMFTTLGMILTQTDPETLAELREANPEVERAAMASEKAWRACGESERVNCATLERAMSVTETRLSTPLWDHSAIADRCLGGELDLEHADCALAAGEVDTAKACFVDEASEPSDKAGG